MLSAKSKNTELRVQVVPLHLEPEGAGAAGRDLRRDARQLEGLPVHEQDLEGLVQDATTRTSRSSYYKSLNFWKTPVADCGNGKNDCMDYSKWPQAWTSIKAS